MFKFLLKIFGFSADAGKDAKPEVKTLDQARTIITALRASIEKIGAKFAAASLDLDAHMELGDDSLKTALTAAEGKGSAELATATARIATLETDLAAQQAEALGFKNDLVAAKASLNSVTAENSLFKGALAAKGVKIEATADNPLSQASIETALDTRISLKAREQLARHGINDPLPVDPAADSSKPAAQRSELKGLARVEAAFKAQSGSRN
jgi:hypothetical protein